MWVRLQPDLCDSAGLSSGRRGARQVGNDRGGFGVGDFRFPEPWHHEHPVSYCRLDSSSRQIGALDEHSRLGAFVERRCRNRARLPFSCTVAGRAPFVVHLTAALDRRFLRGRAAGVKRQGQRDESRQLDSHALAFRMRLGQTPFFPGARMPFGSRASFSVSCKRHSAWLLKEYASAMSSMNAMCIRYSPHPCSAAVFTSRLKISRFLLFFSTSFSFGSK